MAVLVSLRTILPVDASAMYRSIENRLRVGEECDPAAVGADRRPDVQIAAESFALR